MAKGKTGDTAKREYNIWAMMRQRCNNPKAENYPVYGGRGIKVCPEWSKFKNFYMDMGDCPEGYTLDRIDTNGDYTPTNCTWSDSETQQNNKTNTIRITAYGETLGIAQWARKTGLSRDLIYHRIYNMRMNPEEAFETKKMSHVIKRVQQFDLCGNLLAEYPSLMAASIAVGRDKRTIHPALVGKSKTALGCVWKYVE